MPLAQLVATVRSAFNAGTSVFGAQVAAWFAAHPGIIVQALSYNRPDSTFVGDQQTLRIAYLQATAPALGGTWEARYYQSDPSAGQTAQDQFNADFTPPSTPAVVPMFLLDVTDHERDRTGPDALLAVCLRTDVGPLGEVGYDRAAFIASPLGNIAAGATGNALILDASGRTVSASLPVTNVGLVQWDLDQRNYVVYDEEGGTYIGLPSCCGADVWAPPVETTTTPFPCPAYFDEPVPTTSPDQPAPP